MSKITIFGEHDEKTLAQMERCMGAGSAVAGILCADGHLGYAHPIGGVVGYSDHISISGVGFDIACGNMAVKLDTRFATIKESLPTILADISKSVSFGIGRSNAEKVDHDLFDSDLWTAAEVPELKAMAQAQLGTVGSGNHYVDLFEGDDGHLWIGVHFGSRGLGHKITTKYLKAAGAKDGIEVDPALRRCRFVISVVATLPASRLAGSMPMRAANGWLRRCARSSEVRSNSWFTITITSRGAKRMAVSTCGSSERARRRHSRANMALSAARWAMTR